MSEFSFDFISILSPGIHFSTNSFYIESANKSIKTNTTTADKRGATKTNRKLRKKTAAKQEISDERRQQQEDKVFVNEVAMKEDKDTDTEKNKINKLKGRVAWNKVYSHHTQRTSSALDHNNHDSYIHGAIAWIWRKLFPNKSKLSNSKINLEHDITSDARINHSKLIQPTRYDCVAKKKNHHQLKKNWFENEYMSSASVLQFIGSLCQQGNILHIPKYNEKM